MSVTSLQSAPWLVRPETQRILAVLDGDLRRTRAVGGVVRDTIMERQRDNPDIDMATELLPQEVTARAQDAGIAVYPTGIEHGTVTLKLGEVLAEVTTLRQDVKTFGRHAEVVFGTDWVADAGRRDFTLNALYCAADGTLYDPLNGVGDALAGRVRFIGDAARRITEDGLRVYRFFRFSASHGGQHFDPDGLAATRAAVGRLDHLSRERVGQEMLRLLSLPQVARTLALMAEIGLIQLERADVERLVAYEALGGHSPSGRLALWPLDAARLQESWRLSNEMVRAIGDIDRAAELLARDRVGEAAYRYGEAAVEGLAVVAARSGWSRERLAETARELGRLQIPRLPVSGHDLAGLGFTPGPALGQHLARLEQAWIESGFTLSKSELLALPSDQ